MPDSIQLTLTAMAHGGSALGRHAGQVIFVPYAIPGETVRVEILESQARWAKARLLEVIEPSPHRVSPPCPYFGAGRCSGCHFQHIDYEAQAEFKQQVVADQLIRVGGLEGIRVEDIIGAAEPWSYRNQVQFSIDADGNLAFPTNDGQWLPVQECLLLDPLLDDLWSALDMEWPQLGRLSLRCGSATGDLLAIFELEDYQDFEIEVDFPVSCTLLLADGETVVLMGVPHLMEHVDGREYRISAASPFPPNTGGAEALVALVRDYLAPQGHETLVDLGCGVGLFGLALAGDVARVVGVESRPSAAADFRANAADLGHVTLLEKPVGEALTEWEGPADLVVLHPPRQGVGRETIEALARLAPQRIVYVSSDPATFARDARVLVEQEYRLDVVQPVDLWPQTFHVACVALLSRGESR